MCWWLHVQVEVYVYRSVNSIWCFKDTNKSIKVSNGKVSSISLVELIKTSMVVRHMCRYAHHLTDWNEINTLSFYVQIKTVLCYFKYVLFSLIMFVFYWIVICVYTTRYWKINCCLSLLLFLPTCVFQKLMTLYYLTLLKLNALI